MGRLVINGDEIYELDEECLREKQKQNRRRQRLQDEQNGIIRQDGMIRQERTTKAKGPSGG